MMRWTAVMLLSILVLLALLCSAFQLSLVRHVRRRATDLIVINERERLSGAGGAIRPEELRQIQGGDVTHPSTEQSRAAITHLKDNALKNTALSGSESVTFVPARKDRQVSEVDVDAAGLRPWPPRLTWKQLRKSNQTRPDMVRRHLSSNRDLSTLLSVVMFPKDYPNDEVPRAVRKMLGICRRHRVRLYFIRSRLLFTEHLDISLREMEQEYADVLTVVRIHHYCSHNEIRSRGLELSETPYTMFTEDGSWCAEEDCLEVLVDQAERDAEEERQREDDDRFIPFRVWTPMFIEECGGVSRGHQFFQPFLERRQMREGVERVQLKPGHQHEISTQRFTSGVVSKDVEFLLSHWEKGLNFLEDHSYVVHTEFFRAIRKFVYAEDAGHRFDYLHHALGALYFGGRIRPMPHVEMRLRFWCPVQPESTHWVFFRRYWAGLIRSCETFWSVWGAEIPRCFGYPLKMIEGTHTEAYSLLHGTFPPAYSAPTSRRGVYHCQLILSTLVAGGASHFHLTVNGVRSKELDVHELLSEAAGQSLDGSELDVAQIEVGEFTVADQLLAQKTPGAERRLKFLENVLETKLSEEGPPRWLPRVQTYGENAGKYMAMKCSSKMNPDWRGDAMMVLRGRAGTLSCGEAEPPQPVYMYFFLLSDDVVTTIDDVRAALPEGYVLLGNESVIPIPGHAVDDTVQVVWWQYKSHSTAELASKQ